MNYVNAGVGIPFCRPNLDLGCICNQSFGELCAVEGQIWFLGEQGDATFEVEFTQGLDCAEGTASSVCRQ